MQPIDRHHYSGAKLADFLHRYCLWLLVGCYALATVWNVPGQAMRKWEWNPSFASHAKVTLPLLLLALLLFCAALLTDLSKVRSVGQRPWALLLGLLGVWVGPALLVVVAGWLVPWAIGSQDTAGLMVGLALAASMPVANSSVGWTQMVEGNLALSLALVLVSISLCPWATPQILSWLGLSLAPADRAYGEALVTQFSGAFFIAWVILPTAAGMVCRFLFGPARVAAIASWVGIASVAALLVLNYVNAALAFPEVLQQSKVGLLVTTAVLAVALSAVGLAVGWILARLMGETRDTQAALMFGLSMKHTGLALLLAGEVLEEERLAILMIVLATLAQHLLAGIVQWWRQRV